MPCDEENYSSDKNVDETRKNTLNLRSLSKKVSAVPRETTETTYSSSIPMATQLQMQHSKSQKVPVASKGSEVQSNTPTSRTTLATQKQQEKTRQLKAVVAPGTPSGYVKLKANLKEKEVREKQSGALL